jgi:hypothetical protein
VGRPQIGSGTQATALEIGELLKDCTVKLASTDGNVTKTGTAFFVAPGRLLTCLHVIQGTSPVLEAEWRGQRLGVHVDGVDQNGRDLALLSLDSVPSHPCCVIGEEYPYIGERLLTFGYTDTYPLGDSGSYECEGISKHQVDGWLLKVQAGQAFPGMSGGPLIRLQTGQVCAVMATERLNNVMGGARALPIDTACQIWPELKALQQSGADCSKQWVEVFRKAARGEEIEDGFEFSIPKGWTFRDVVDTMTRVVASVVDYEKFTEEELNARIQSRMISAKTPAEAIDQLRLMTTAAGVIRPYQVNRKGSMYLLTVS